MDRASTIRMNISLFEKYSLQSYDEHILPEYHYDFPIGSDCYAAITNTTNGIESQVSVEFSELTFSFLSSLNVSMADVLQFLSVISSEQMQVSDIKNTDSHIDTEIPSPDGVYCVQSKVKTCCLQHFKEMQNSSIFL